MVKINLVAGYHTSFQKFHLIVKLSLLSTHQIGICSNPRSVLLQGPSGTGKSKVIQIIATYYNIPILRVTYHRLIHFHPGEPAKGLDSLIALAHRIQPSILLVDNIHTLFPSNSDTTDVTIETKQDLLLIGKFLMILQKLHESKSRTIVVGVSNNVSILHPIVRARFEYEIRINTPTIKERTQILASLAHNSNSQFTYQHINWPSISQQCRGYVGADLEIIYCLALQRAIQRSLHDSHYLLKQGEKMSQKTGKLCNDITKQSIARILDTVSINEKIKVKQQDFSQACINYRPSTAEPVDVDVKVVNWDDIGGLVRIKQRLKEMIVWPARHLASFMRMGLRPPLGLLMYGAPGTGKTMLAQAVATEAAANFLPVSIPDIIKSGVGDSEKAIVQLFKKARSLSPCVIFLDEFDAMFGSRSQGGEWAQKIISQLLLSLDDLHTQTNETTNWHHTHVIVLAATNMPDRIDSALLRPGRFDCVIYIPPPDYNARCSILRLIKKTEVVWALDVNIETISKRTEGFTGADLWHLASAAGLAAWERDQWAESVSMCDWDIALASIHPSCPASVDQAYQKWQCKK